jgi:hypothetical protein
LFCIGASQIKHIIKEVKMNRRSFLRKCIVGVAIGGASLIVRGEGVAEKADVTPVKIDPEGLEKRSLVAHN